MMDKILDFLNKFPYVRVFASVIILVGLIKGAHELTGLGLFVLCFATIFGY